MKMSRLFGIRLMHFWCVLMCGSSSFLFSECQGRASSASKHLHMGEKSQDQEAFLALDDSSWQMREPLTYVGFDTSYSGPYIEDFHPANISAQDGSHAYLPCIVKRLGSKSVSWIRKSDSYLLTVDRDTFIADSRFESLHLMASDTWTLHIRNVRPEDQGSYECQVSSEPKTSLLFQLNIISPQVEIKGAPDVYVNSGSQVELVCLLTDVLEEPPFIFWYYGDERLMMDSAADAQSERRHKRRHQSAPVAQPWVAHHSTKAPSTGWSESPIDIQTQSEWNDSNVYDDYQYNYDYYQYGSTPSRIDGATHSDYQPQTPPSPPRKLRKPSIRTSSISRIKPGVIQSKLTITNPSKKDSGQYQCLPSNMNTANVTLHVLDGEHEEPAAAVQDGSNSSSAVHWRICISAVLAITMTTSILV